MVNTVTIGSVIVDADDPCALYTVLYNTRLQMISGQSIGEVQAGDANAQRRIRYNTASLSALDAELARLADLCAQSSGGRPSRFAMRAGFRRLPS
jgi:hypothetical protein